ncbi:MAG: polysaccharide deacetylase family protein, partial [Verrucomicrobiota bacterium]|nr:polysaccharide deacetylase family protein [Verrucomicrobiota bacterium]
YALPATVFLATGYLGAAREFWWDELEQLLLAPGRLPKSLRLMINGELHHWDLGPAAEYGEEDRGRDRSRRAWDGEPGSRFFLYYSVWQRLRVLSHDARQHLLGEIREWAGMQVSARPGHRPLTLDEVGALRKGELIEIGAHTVTHPSLPARETETQRVEISKSKTDLEALLNEPVTSFAYPFGDYTAETVALVRDAGFACACSTVCGMVWPAANRFELPRIEVQDWDGEEFQARLSSWFRD